MDNLALLKNFLAQRDSLAESSGDTSKEQPIHLQSKEIEVEQETTTQPKKLPTLPQNVVKATDGIGESFSNFQVGNLTLLFLAVIVVLFAVVPVNGTSRLQIIWDAFTGMAVIG